MSDRRLYADQDASPLDADQDGSPLYQDPPWGDITFALALAGDGFTLIDGDGAVAFVRAFSGDGWVTVNGTGAAAFGFGLTGSGTVDGGEVIAPESPVLSGRVPRYQLAPIPQPRIVGRGSVAFTFAAGGRGRVNDDELVLGLLLGVPA